MCSEAKHEEHNTKHIGRVRPTENTKHYVIVKEVRIHPEARRKGW